MSRLLKLVACAVALVAGGAAALAAGSAPARSAQHMIICPLEPNDTVTTTCCGPPIVTAARAAFVCCATPLPIACPVGLIASSSPNPSVAGAKVTIAGRSPGNAAGQTVDLWQELPGAKKFDEIAHTTTGSLGEFQFVRKGVETNRKWYVTVGSEHSLTVDQRVKAVVTLSYDRAIKFHGQVTPNHAGERVTLERQAGSDWVVLARPRLSMASTFTKVLCAAGPVRVAFPGDRRNVRSVSAAADGTCGPY